VTMPSADTLDRTETLYVTDAELIRRMGVAPCLRRDLPRKNSFGTAIGYADSTKSVTVIEWSTGVVGAPEAPALTGGATRGSVAR
jgi:hypothetical protein